MATINISYSGTNLKFCDGTQAINGNGWYGPTTIEVDENNDTIVEVELELVYVLNKKQILVVIMYH